MTYAMSDLHGCYKEFTEMLKKIRFSDEDTLYILGDIGDRGPEPMKILLDIAERKNVFLITGNHDLFAKTLLPKYGFKRDDGTYKEPETLDELDEIDLWDVNGGMVTLQSFRELSDEEKEKAFRVLNSSVLYTEIAVNGNIFFLSHTVPEKAKFNKKESMAEIDYVWDRPDFGAKYSEEKNRYIVIGHTPTRLIDESYKGKIWKKNNLIDIDCGCVFGYGFGCICLDTFEEFYLGKDDSEYATVNAKYPYKILFSEKENE